VATKQTKQVIVRRLTLVSTKAFDSVVGMIETAIGHPNMSSFANDIANAETYTQMEQFIQSGLGSSGFMEFARFDLGTVLRKERGAGTPKVLRLVIGNPLIMKEMVRHVPDAGSYAPVTILIDERPDGVHISYDTMESFLAPYGNEDALKVARDLDAKIEKLLTQAL
jgi:uncharacterized protein (DUF302 family)